MMKKVAAPPVPEEFKAILDPLPEGFRRAVLGANPHGDLVGAIRRAWSKSTIRQRREAEPGVIAVLLKVRPTWESPSFQIGALAAYCPDLNVTALVEDKRGNDRPWIDNLELLRGVVMYDGLRVHWSLDGRLTDFVVECL